MFERAARHVLKAGWQTCEYTRLRAQEGADRLTDRSLTLAHSVSDSELFHQRSEWWLAQNTSLLSFRPSHLQQRNVTLLALPSSVSLTPLFLLASLTPLFLLASLTPLFLLASLTPLFLLASLAPLFLLASLTPLFLLASLAPLFLLASLTPLFLLAST